MQIKLNENGYVSEFLLSGSAAVLPDGMEAVTDGVDFEDFLENFAAYTLVEGQLVKDDARHTAVQLENRQNHLRSRRNRECFPIINRGSLWYKTLTEEQAAELATWYRAWLDVTETMQSPARPLWLR